MAVNELNIPERYFILFDDERIYIFVRGEKLPIFNFRSRSKITDIWTIQDVIEEDTIKRNKVVQ